jgi:hypothetical protein
MLLKLQEDLPATISHILDAMTHKSVPDDAIPAELTFMTVGSVLVVAKNQLLGLGWSVVRDAYEMTRKNKKIVVKEGIERGTNLTFYRIKETVVHPAYPNIRLTVQADDPDQDDVKKKFFKELTDQAYEMGTNGHLVFDGYTYE